MRLIDRDEMLSPKIWDMNIPIPKEVYDSIFELYSRLIHIPTVDAEPVIRCKDCKFWGEEQEHYCGAIDDPYMLETDADDFCSWGEKK